MNEKQKKCILEIQELMIMINKTVEKYELQDEFLSVMSLGFLDISTMYIDEQGNNRANMNLISSFNVDDEYELEEMLSYCAEAFLMEQEEQEKDSETRNIDYWINFGRDNGSVN